MHALYRLIRQHRVCVNTFPPCLKQNTYYFLDLAHTHTTHDTTQKIPHQHHITHRPPPAPASQRQECRRLRTNPKQMSTAGAATRTHTQKPEHSARILDTCRTMRGIPSDRTPVGVATRKLVPFSSHFSCTLTVAARSQLSLLIVLVVGGGGVGVAVCQRRAASQRRASSVVHRAVTNRRRVSMVSLLLCKSGSVLQTHRHTDTECTTNKEQKNATTPPPNETQYILIIGRRMTHGFFSPFAKRPEEKRLSR